MTSRALAAVLVGTSLLTASAARSAEPKPGRLCLAGSLGEDADALQVSLDGIPLGLIEPATFICVDATQGRHDVQVDQLPADRTCAIHESDEVCLLWERREGSASSTFDVQVVDGRDTVQFTLTRGELRVDTLRTSMMARYFQRQTTPIVDRLDRAFARDYTSIAERSEGPPAEDWHLAARIEAIRGHTDAIDAETARIITRCRQDHTEQQLIRGALRAPRDTPLGLALYEAGAECAPTPAQREVLRAAEAEAARVAALPREPLVDALARATQTVEPGSDARDLTALLGSVAGRSWEPDPTAALVQLCLDAGTGGDTMVDAVTASTAADPVQRFADAGLACGVERRVLEPDAPVVDAP